MSWVLAMIVAAIMAATGAISSPPTAGVADYQLGGAYAPAANVQIVTRDRTDQPAEGLYSICYVNAFQSQPDALGWWMKNHPSLLLRDARDKLVIDPGWPDEVIFDIRTADRRRQLASIVGAWFDQCAKDGYRAIEPDNLDAWTRSRKLTTRAETVSLARLLVTRAHAAGLAIAQKNTPQLSTAGIGFDFAVAEECEVYRECGDYTDTYGSRLIEIEYTDNGVRAYERACAARGGEASIMLRDRDVVPVDSPDYAYRTC